MEVCGIWSRRWILTYYSLCIGCSSTNKYASTVLSLFLNGVSRFGLPDKVCSDHGGENIDVWCYMLASHNNNPDCVLAGSFIHNERI